MTTQADHLRLIKIVPFPVHMDNIEITSGPPRDYLQTTQGRPRDNQGTTEGPRMMIFSVPRDP